MQSEINSQIHALLTDPDFLGLSRSQNRPNLFSTLAASHTEMWHSAFVKWLIDPQSHLGLGDFPLKRFLFTVLHDGIAGVAMPNLTIGELEDMDLDRMRFDTEYTANDLRTSLGGKAKIDIRGWSDEIPVKSKHDTTSVQIIVENKIKALESRDQTRMYHDWAKDSEEKFQHNIFVFLTPDEKQKPGSEYFIQITYQNLCDQVIKPCLNHPALPEESKYLLQQYLLNLGKPLKVTGDQVMALSNKEICQKIYDAHKEVLDEIFVSVKSEAPQSVSGAKAHSSSIQLEHLVNNGLLNPLSDKLYFARLGTTAELKKRGARIVISHSKGEYESPSGAAKALSGHEEAGWDVWRVRDEQANVDKGTLADLRNRLRQQSSVSPDAVESVAAGEEQEDENLSETSGGLASTDKIEAQFNEAFSRWEIELPQDDLEHGQRGKIIKAGWVIWYLFGSNEKGEFLDYYASHRMTNDSHVRIYADGHSELLPAIQEMRLSSEDPEEDARLDAEYYGENQRVAKMLEDKGFGVQGDEPGGV